MEHRRPGRVIWYMEDGRKEGPARVVVGSGIGDGEIPLLAGDMKEYGTLYKQGGADINPVWIVQHKKWKKRRTQVEKKGGVPDQPGPGSPPGNQDHVRNLHPRVSRLQCRQYGHNKPTPRQSGSVLTVFPLVCDRGHSEVQTRDISGPAKGV